MVPAQKMMPSENEDIQALHAAAVGHTMPNGAKVAEISPRDAWAYLSRNSALLVDVRTHAEWLFVGGVNLDSTPSRIAEISWKHYPTFAQNPQFFEQLQTHNVTKETPLFFLCRSGGRSLDAALAASAHGYKYCFNITGGFEGDQDNLAHRGNKDGWKAAQLPWRQG